MDPGNRQVPLLALLFAISGTGSVVVVTVAAVTAFDLSGSTRLATLPVGLSMLGAMLATLPFAHLMARRGRRLGFTLSTSFGLAGALLAAYAIHVRSFWLFCAGSLLIGVITGVGQLYRFAAVDVSPPQRHAKAIGTVLAGGVVAGVAGPLIAAQAKDLWGDAPYAGSYLAFALLAVLVLLLLSLLRVPLPPPVAKGTGRRLPAIARDPRFVAAVLASVAAFVAMVVTMVAAPLSLRHLGHEGAIAYVIQAHVVAMYLPSFVSGPLIGRIGAGRGMALGIGGLAACSLVNLAGQTVTHHYVALVLLGVGWNLLFVAGSTLLTRVPGPGEKATVQGTNDLFVSAAGAIAAFGAGPLHAVEGWPGLNLVVLAGLAVVGVALVLLLRRPAPSNPAPAEPTVAAAAR